jgi:predicted nucleic acid-binding protein
MALGGLASKHGIERGRMPRSLINDALLAVTCIEAGVVLLTDNTRDFKHLREFLPVRYVQPWPQVTEG